MAREKRAGELGDRAQKLLKLLVEQYIRTVSRSGRAPCRAARKST